MAKVRLSSNTKGMISVDFEGKTYDIGGAYSEIPDGALEKLRQHVPDRIDVLAEPATPVAPPAKR